MFLSPGPHHRWHLLIDQKSRHFRLHRPHWPLENRFLVRKFSGRTNFSFESPMFFIARAAAPIFPGARSRPAPLIRWHLFARYPLGLTCMTTSSAIQLRWYMRLPTNLRFPVEALAIALRAARLAAAHIIKAYDRPDSFGLIKKRRMTS